MKFQMTWPNLPHTRYAQDAFDGMIGKEVTIAFNGPDAGAYPDPMDPRIDLLRGKATLLEAEVGPDATLFTFEINDPETAVEVAAYAAIGAFNNISILE